MSKGYRLSLWDVANGILAAWLVITLAGGPRRLPPDWLVQQTWSMHYAEPDGRPISTNFIFQTFKAREQFGPFIHEYHWFGPPTIEMPVLPGKSALSGKQLLPETPVLPANHKLLYGTYVE